MPRLLRTPARKRTHNLRSLSMQQMLYNRQRCRLNRGWSFVRQRPARPVYNKRPSTASIKDIVVIRNVLWHDRPAVNPRMGQTRACRKAT